MQEFHKRKASKDGLAPICKDCVKIKCEQYRNENREDIRRRGREGHAKNKAKRNASARASYQKHKEKIKDYQKQYAANHPEKIAKRRKKKLLELRNSFIEMYGKCCALCDPLNPDAWRPEFLTLDHVRGDGAEERRSHNRNQWWAYRDAIKDGVPNFAKYRILCCNHNFSLGNPRKPFDQLSPNYRNERLMRDSVIEGYGGKCACCGESEFEFLQLDHVNGGGLKQRKAGGGSRVHYRDAFHRNFPPDYQVLCANCNRSKHYGKGICIHNRDEEYYEIQGVCGTLGAQYSINDGQTGNTRHVCVPS